MRPRQLLLVIVIALGLAALMDARSLERSAQTSPFGLRRSVELTVLRPLVTVSDHLALDRPRMALDALLHRSDDGGPAPPEPASLPPPQQVRVASSGLRLRLPATGEASPPPAAPRVRTAADPLRLWVGGDSVAGFLCYEMEAIAEHDPALAVRTHFQISTGLSRPDYYDWPAHLAQDTATGNPEVVVLLVGANDDQPLETPGGGVADFATPEWVTEYGRRAGALMDQVRREGRTVVWVGLPVMRAHDFGARMDVIDNAARRQAARRPGVLFLDSRPLFSDAGGAYAAYLPDDSGALTLMRAPDGVHLSPQGGTRLAEAVLRLIRDHSADPALALPRTGRAR
ncbi:MAG: DUF459 domain-containing protein [Chloroflexi bacterium]|nr:MAG: DUF459 domain-containing protein [Chloroflexota bacterium]